MKIGLLITARLKSTRLPQKLLMDLNGRSIIERVIDRAKKVQSLDEIVLCTSINQQDKPLTDIALKNNVHYFLGHPEDVIGRLNNAADFFNLDYIISITGENPLFSIYHTNLLINHIKEKGGDFVYFDGLPLGCATTGINKLAMEVVCKIKDILDTEIWGPLLKRPDIFDVQNLEVEEVFKRADLRITTDYIEDYQFIQKLFSYFPSNYTPSYFEIIALLKQKPELEQIHAMRNQEALGEDVLKKIEELYRSKQKEVIAIKEEIFNR